VKLFQLSLVSNAHTIYLHHSLSHTEIQSILAVLTDETRGRIRKRCRNSSHQKKRERAHILIIQ
jgi:hypothetical protein